MVKLSSIVVSVFCDTDDGANTVVRYTCVPNRVLFLDLSILEHVYRAVAVYAPHAGYPQEDFNTTFDNIRKVILDGQLGYRCLM